MSNRCSNLCNYRSFSFCNPFLTPLKPYATTLRPFFPLQHKLILVGRRSRSRSSPLHLTLASQSDLVLIATTEHRDGSLVFRFGDASEVVENDVVEEVEGQTEQESGDVKVLDGDQDAQVIVKTGGRGYASVEGRVIEVADGIRNADVDCDIAESETSAIRGLRDYHAESIERLSYISEKGVLLSQSDAKMNNSTKVAESAPDEAKSSVQLDEEESSDPTVNLLDNSLNIEKGANPEGTHLNVSYGKNVEPAVPIELESMQVSQVESMDDLDKVEEDTRKSDIEDIVPSAFPATMHISDIELTATNEDKEEDLKDMIINESNLIDELSPSNPIDVPLIVSVNEDVEEELQDMNINEATIIDEMPSCDQLVVEPTLDEVSPLQYVHVKDQTVEHELPQVSTEITEENDVAYVMPVSHIEEAERAVEEEVIQPQSPTTQVLNIDLQDTMGQNLDDGILKVDNETNNPLIAVKLETIQLSDNEVMDVTQPYTKDESHMVECKDISEGDTKDFSSPATMHVSDVDVDVDERLEDMKISEATFIDEMTISDPLGAEPTLEVSTTSKEVKDVAMDERLQDMNIIETSLIDERPTSDPLGAEPTLEVSSIEGMNVKNLAVEDDLQLVSNDKMDENEIADVMPAEPILEEEVSQPHLTPVELKPTMQVSGIEVQDATFQNLDDEILQVISEDAGNSYIEDIEQSSHQLESQPIQDEGVKHNILEQERLQDMNISKGTFMDEMPTCDPLGDAPTLDVSTTEGMNVKDLAVEDELQLVSIDKMDENEIADVLPAEPILEQMVSPPHLTPVELKATMQVSDIKVQNATGQNLDDETLLVIKDDAGESYIEYVDQSPHQLESQPVQAERLQDMNISEGTFMDEMPTSDPLEAESSLEVSTTEDMDVKDLTVEDELQLVSINKMDENEFADVMPAEPILVKEVSQPHLTPVGLKVTMQVSDIKVQDATGQNPDGEIVQVINEDVDDNYIEDVEQSPHQLESHPVQDEGVKHNMIEQCAESDAVESSGLLNISSHDPLLEAERTEDMVDSSEFAEASEVTALLLAVEAEVEREKIYLTDDILLSGAALLEHPFKALTGGDDAYFVAGRKWLGVASGVSQWSFEGTGPGVYAQKLMRTCEEIVLDATSAPVTNPVELLCRGVKETNMSGSSSVLIANFNGQTLHVANIGDTGFLIIRHGAVFKKSSPLLHEFHFALQVEDSDNPLQIVEEHLIELEVGDIVVSATDGLFDNLYDREISMIVSKSLQAGMKPQEIANILATRAQEVGKSAFVRSPFSDAAQAAGYTGYAGGKPDNVAVIVSLVE